jgi:hypothetical protein
MGKIYSTAQQTIIHLSHNDGQKILEAIPGNTTGNTTSYVHEDLIATAENTLLKIPWFRRVWVFQELVLSRNPWVQCGTVRAKWSELCEILLKPNEEDKPLGKEMWVLNQMNYARTYKRDSLYRYLIERRGLGATDPRDFIFAHMSIAADAVLLGNYVKVDYESSCGRIYNETALYLLEKKGPETLFNLATNNTDKSCIEGLASWSPNWSVPLDGPELMYIRHGFRTDGQDHFFSLDVEGSLMLGCLALEIGAISLTSLSFPDAGEFETSVRQAYQQAWTNLKTFYQDVMDNNIDMTTKYDQIPIMTTDEEAEHKQLVSILIAEFMGYDYYGNTFVRHQLLYQKL